MTPSPIESGTAPAPGVEASIVSRTEPAPAPTPAAASSPPLCLDGQLLRACGRGDAGEVESLLDQGVSIEGVASIPSHDPGQPRLVPTPLTHSCGAGRRDIVELLLARGADPAACNSIKNSPLMCAAFQGHEPIVSLLLGREQVRRTINHCADSGATALILACAKPDFQNVGIVHLLIDHGAEVNARDSLRQLTSLLWAQERRCKPVVAALLSRGADLEARDNYGRTALIRTVLDSTRRKEAEAGLDDGDFVNFLLDNGAEIDAKDASQSTALSLACYFGKIELAALLLRRGADVEIQDFQCYSPLMRACQLGLVDVAAFLLRQGANPLAKSGNEKMATALSLASYFGHEPIVRLLLSPDHNHSIDVNVQSHGGCTPLYLACQQGWPVVAALLIDCGGADLEARSTTQLTPLMIACVNQHEQVVAVLLARGADSKACGGPRALTPLHLVCVSSPPSPKQQQGSSGVIIVKALIESGANVHALESENLVTPLARACIVGRADLVEAFLDSGADIDSLDSAKWTPLMHAAIKSGAAGAVAVLVKRGANLDAVEDNGLNALLLASANAQLEACLILVNPGGMDPTFLFDDDRRASALTLYGFALRHNDPAHPPVPADPKWRPRPTDAERDDAQAQILAARAEFLLQKKRDENWARRRVFLQTLLAGGLRHSAAQKAEQAALQAAVDTSAELPTVLRDREYLKQQVFGHEGVVRGIASFL